MRAGSEGNQVECNLSLNQFCMRGHFLRHRKDFRHSSINGTIRFKGGVIGFYGIQQPRRATKKIRKRKGRDLQIDTKDHDSEMWDQPSAQSLFAHGSLGRFLISSPRTIITKLFSSNTLQLNGQKHR